MTEITFKGTPTKVEGNRPNLNEAAPKFSLENTKGETVDNDTVKGKKVLISVFPDINTSVCDLQTRHMYELLKEHTDIEILNVSNNTKEDLKNWCLLKDIDMEMLIDEDRTFADAYGLWMPEFEKLARSVFILDEEGKLVYYELVPEMAQEPDFESLKAHL